MIRRLFSITQFIAYISITFILTACNSATTAVSTSTPSPEQTATETAVPTPITTPTFEAPLQYLALGDSYTIGESVAEIERWPIQLTTRLQEQNINITSPEIIARTGWTTDELAGAIVNTNPQGPYDLVSLLIGVNNQYRGYSQESYQEEFAELLEQAIGFAGGDAQKVIVVSIPDWGVTPFASRQDATAIGAEIDAFNTINRTEAEKAGVTYIDITLISRKAPDHPNLIADDGLHPSGEMYTEWVDLIEPIVIEILVDKEIGD